MPNWAGSSWYFIRYCDPNNNHCLADREKLNFWLPVDVYNGGMEHTTLHLLYSRFWYKFLSDLNLVPGTEPYKKRISHGMILGADNQKMSKSLGNVINPDSIVNKFGSDTLRTYILFIGPYDDAIAWNPTSIFGVSRFLKRFWSVVQFISQKESEFVTRAAHQSIKKISQDYDNFHFNTAVSTMMEFVNLVYKEKNVTKQTLAKMLTVFYPVAPHICSEMYSLIAGQKNRLFSSWPAYDLKYVSDKLIEIPIQINGKLRDQIMIIPETPVEEIEKLCINCLKIKKWLAGKRIKKIIYIKNKIVNIVLW